MDKIVIPQNTFGKYLRFTNTPEDWSVGVWFSVWTDRNSPFVQGECDLIDGQWCYLIQEGDFPTPGIFSWELCQYVGGTVNDVTMRGTLEVVESAKKPS